MREFRGVVSAFLLSLLLEPAAAPAQPQQQAPQQDRDDRVVCRGERFTGTRIATRRRCRTAAEWEEDDRHARNLSVRAIDNRETRAPEHNSDAPPSVGAPSTNSPFVPPRN